MENPKVFISYSWKPILNKERTIDLAERLVRDGVYVIIDEWDLKEGQDKYTFMEQMVNDPEVKRVLLICNEEYANKANSKSGGVGIESLIISPEIYNKADQVKFVPVVFEKDENYNAFLPTFAKSRIYIDLSNDEIFEDEYEKLLRNIFDKPASSRPPLGVQPAFLDQKDEIVLPTKHKVSAIKHALVNERRNAILLIQDYLDTFASSIFQYVPPLETLSTNDFDEIIYQKIEDTKPLLKDFIELVDVYTTYSLDFDAERFHSFFEKLISFIYNVEEVYHPYNSIGYLQWDGIRFFYYELFLYFTAKMIDKERFSELGFILNNSFLIHLNDLRMVQSASFSALNIPVDSLSVYRKKRLNSNSASLTADLIHQRASDNDYWKKIQEAELLLYYISLFDFSKDSLFPAYWFPNTSCYRISHVSIMGKAISKRYFDKIKPLFGVSSKEELVEKVRVVIERNGTQNLNSHFFRFPEIAKGLMLNDICTVK